MDLVLGFVENINKWWYNIRVKQVAHDVGSNPTLAIEFSAFIYSIEIIAIAFLGAFVGKLVEKLKGGIKSMLYIGIALCVVSRKVAQW